MEQENNVKVAVRIRPQLPKEIIDICHICTRVTPNEPQVWLGTDKAFTYDHVFDTNTKQDHVYDACVMKLIEGCFEGYNATVLAYGQTGSGKTYTMGTGFDMGSGIEKGIIPRAVEHLFTGIAQIQKQARERGDAVPEFKVNAQFLELYNEDIIDLLGDERLKHSQIKIHEDTNGQIYTIGVTTRPVASIEETLQCLKMGALSRTTASTQMNAQSSRSHAIFTLHIKQHRIIKIESSSQLENGSIPIEHEINGDIGSQEIETLTAKFHFVDLAGSERLKRTGATGERAREGISINSGLLALGNVISSLGDKSKRATHVPYRDSKLTRLLQDSLGGNSMTLMIACVSPSDRDFMETLNTLRYANRAKNIKNKVTANQDKSSQTITALRREIQQLQIELQEYKQGKRLIDDDGTEKINDMYHENTMLQSEINNLKTRVKALQETNERLTARNVELLVERETGTWITSNGTGEKSDIRDIVHGYVKEIEDLRAKLMEMEETCSQFRKQAQRQQNHRLSLSPYSGAVAMSGPYDIRLDAETSSTADVIGEARKHINKVKKLSKQFGNKSIKDDSHADTNGNDIDLNNENAENEEPEDEDIDNDSNTDEDDEDEDIQNGDANVTELALMELTNEIGIKEKLIMELEKTQRRMNNLKQQYEEKLMLLQNKIAETETERDRVLAKYNSVGNQSDEKAKKVKEEYEKKLYGLQSEMRKLQAAKKEHAFAMKSQTAHENQMRLLRNEVSEMKKHKVKLLSKMKEDAQKHRESELRNSKKIAQLTKIERQKDIKIRSLENESTRYKNLLKRKDDDINALKRRAKPMSDRVAGRSTISSRVPSARRALPFSPVAAKHKWQRLEQDINKLVLNKQTIACHEKQMDRYLQQRQQLGRALDKTRKKYERALREGKSESILQEFREEIENIEANVKYFTESIDDVQSTITQIEDVKDGEGFDASELLSQVKVDEIKYLFDKLMSMAISQSLIASQKEEERKEYEFKYKQVADNSLIQEQLLHHVLDTTFLDSNIDDYNNPNFESDFNYRPAPYASDNFIAPHHPPLPPHHQPLPSHIHSLPPLPSNDYSMSKSEKARRLTKTPQELLFETSMASASESRNRNSHDAMTQSLIAPVTAQLMSIADVEIQRVPSAPSLKESFFIPPIVKSELFYSPSFKRRTYERLPLIDANRSRTRTSSLSQSSSGNSLPPQQSLSIASRHLSAELSESSPSNSPPVSRRIRDDNDVFSRLTSGTITNNQINTDRAGHISTFTGRPQFDKNVPLVCTHVAEGHTRAVLSVVATNDVLFSGSKDCSVKIWDLHTGTEVQSLCDHPDAVPVVRYNEYSRLAFSVSKSFIKVWDPRDNPARCVKTLNSSGLVSQNSFVNSNVPKNLELAPGESAILDVQLSTYGTTLFSTCSRIVRVWDLRMYHCIGKLNTGHSAGIICMAVEEAGVDNNIVVTGSKDHYIKVFEVMEGVGGIHNPKMTLKPPHYDGIESLVINGDYLFSGSRDACIKKWDLPNQRLVQSLNYCHKDWIQALSVMPNTNTLLSGCRSGQLKLWSTDTCQLISDIKAHSNAIHSIDTNSALVFTASADNTINLWRWKSNTDQSPDYSETVNE